MRRLAILVGLLVVAVAAAVVALPRAERPDERVARLSSELRCPVCQGLSVNDSPSVTAREMRALVARRVAEGRSDDEIREEFRTAYGDWILLSPPTGDARGLIWLAPLIAVGAGVLLVLARVRSAPVAVSAPTPEQRALLRERARLEEGEA